MAEDHWHMLFPQVMTKVKMVMEGVRSVKKNRRIQPTARKVVHLRTVAGLPEVLRELQLPQRIPHQLLGKTVPTSLQLQVPLKIKPIRLPHLVLLTISVLSTVNYEY